MCVGASINSSKAQAVEGLHASHKASEYVSLSRRVWYALQVAADTDRQRGVAPTCQGGGSRLQGQVQTNISTR